MLQSISINLRLITAIDLLPKNVSSHQSKEVLNRNQRESDGLTQVLNIKVDTRFSLTLNTDLQDSLVNRQLGTVKYNSEHSTDSVIKIYIKVDDKDTRLKGLNPDNFAKQHLWVPIEKNRNRYYNQSKKISSLLSKEHNFH